MFIIPSERLPPGFAEWLDHPPAEPVAPRPAATAVLLRDGDEGPEALLLRRHRASGFVPGAYVFPGGRVDEADGEARLLARAPGVPDEPPAAYWLAALREIFEETGVLLAHDGHGRAVPDATAEPRLAEWRERLMENHATLADVLEAEAAEAGLERVVYAAHWITPVVEPRRYDTRFFLAALPPGREVAIDAREMTDALWLPPAVAMERFRAGRLPMVFPTIRTLESLQGFGSVEETLAAFRGRPVRAILPRLVRTPEGVGLVVDD